MARNYSKNYHSQSIFKNPKHRRRIIIKIIVFIIIFAGVFGMGYFFTFSIFFKIKNITVKGNDYIVSAAIINKLQGILSDKRFFVFQNSNINLFDTEDAATILLDAFPRADEINLKKKYPDGIEVAIKEKQVSDILCQESVCFFVDKNGIAFDVAAQTQGFLILKIIDKRGKAIELNSKALNKEFIDFIDIIKSSYKNYLPLNIKWFVLEHPAQREVVATIDDWNIVFDVASNPIKQLFVLQEVLDKEIKDQIINLEYIDLRVDGRAYYKLKAIK